MKTIWPKNTRHLFLAILGLILTSFAFLIFLYNPLEFIIKKFLSFHPNSIVFNLWERPPIDVYLKVYIFNVSNPDEFLDGKEKLRFNEVGPYVYKEILYNENSTFNSNGTLTFTPRRHIKFIPDMSIGDPFVDTLILTNVPLLGITGSLVDESMFINLAVSSISSYLDSQPFLNLSINDYLYGYDDSLVTLANNVVPNWIDFSRFGILDQLMALDNGSNIVTMNIDPEIKMSNNQLLSIKERLQLYSIQRWNGSPGLHQWGYQDAEENETRPENSKCNLVAGSHMGTMFPRDITKGTSFKLYRHAFCRPIPILYDGSRINNDGFEIFDYRVDENFLEPSEVNPDNECYCNKETCLPKGLGDMAPCYYNIPIALSQPHFLNADPSLLENVDGLSPDKNKHDLTIAVHPRIGLPIEAKLRMQINLRMPNTQYNSKTMPFNNLVLPLFWVEVVLDDVPSNIKLYIKLIYHILPIVQLVMVYALALSGFILIFGPTLAAFFYHRHKTNSSFNVNYSAIPMFPTKTQFIMRKNPIESRC